MNAKSNAVAWMKRLVSCASWAIAVDLTMIPLMIYYQLYLDSLEPSRDVTARVVNVLSNYKSACLMYYTDHGQWPSPLPDEESLCLTVDSYTDRLLYYSQYSRIWVVEVEGKEGGTVARRA